MQPVVTSKILIYFSFFFPRFWVIYYFFVSFKLCCRCFINWFTFTFRRRLPADASAARPSLDFVRNFSKNLCFFFFIFIGDGHEFTPLDTSISVVYEFPLMIKYFGDFIMCMWVCGQTCMWYVHVVIYESATHLIFDLDLVSHFCASAFWVGFFFSLLSVYLTYRLICVWTHVYDNLCM